ncbi:MAG TPA: nuclear transport factor 2 family protein [Pyrinomonadaceae bacterium]|nr:nuclear transport factor 2 family protein [Pyrinomonadaceae bacterium]
MKRCPTCMRSYTDDTLNFCLEDGAPLKSVTDARMEETLVLDPNEPPPTEILLDPALGPTVRAQKPYTTVRQEARSTRNEFQDLAAPATRTRNTSSVVAITVVATILLLSLGGLGAWLLLKDNNTGGGNLNGGNNGRGPGGRVDNVNAGTQPDNTPDSRGGNVNTQPNVSPTPFATATPYSTPTPQPSPSPPSTDTGAARREVSKALEGWRQTMVNPNVDAHMSYYADTLHTYYNARNVDVSRVRSNVARAFSSYSTFDVQITNLQIEVDPSGEQATATFDKTFVFANSEKRYTGSGLNRFWFEKIGGRWRITGEKDLKTYY